MCRKRLEQLDDLKFISRGFISEIKYQRFNYYLSGNIIYVLQVQKSDQNRLPKFSSNIFQLSPLFFLSFDSSAFC